MHPTRPRFARFHQLLVAVALAPLALCACAVDADVPAHNGTPGNAGGGEQPSARPPQPSTPAEGNTPSAPGVDPASTAECITTREDPWKTTRVRYRYDAAARTVTIESGIDPTFAGARVTIKTYEANGALQRLDYPASDGDQAFFREFINDSAGNPTQETSGYVGQAPTVVAYTNTYDTAGRVLSVATASLTTSYAYDAAGVLQSVENDYASDGTIEERYAPEYRSDGQLQKVTRDGTYHHQADGSVISYWELTYNAAGQLVQSQRFGGGFFDMPASSRVRVLQNWSYDAAGNVASIVQIGNDESDLPSLNDSPITITVTAACAAVIPHEAAVLRRPTVMGPWL